MTGWRDLLSMTSRAVRMTSSIASRLTFNATHVFVTQHWMIACVFVSTLHDLTDDKSRGQRHCRVSDQQTSQNRHEAVDPHHACLRHQLRSFDCVRQRWFDHSLAVQQLHLLDHISNFFIYLDVIREFRKEAKNMHGEHNDEEGETYSTNGISCAVIKR